MRGEEPDELNGAAEELRREAAALLGGLDAVPEPGLKWRAADLAAIDERVGDAAVIVIDLAGVVTLWSAGAEALYHYARAEAVDRSLCELIFTPEDRSICEQIRDGLAETGTWEGEFWLSRKDASRFLAYVYEATVEDDLGHTVGFIGVSYEVAT